MSVKVHVGVHRKRSSFESSELALCTAEFEVDSALLADPARFHERTEEVYRLCELAVEGQLARQQQVRGSASVRLLPRTGSDVLFAEPQPNVSNTELGNPGSVERIGSGIRPMTASQRRAILTIAGKLGLDIASLLQQQFGLSSIDELNIRQASQIIGSLRTDSGTRQHAVAS